MPYEHLIPMSFISMVSLIMEVNLAKQQIKRWKKSFNILGNNENRTKNIETCNFYMCMKAVTSFILKGKALQINRQ